MLPDAGQPANGQLITTAAGQQCLPLNMIRKPDGKLEFLGITLGQVGKVAILAYARSCHHRKLCEFCSALTQRSVHSFHVLHERLQHWHHDSMPY